ncbi:Uncharacterized protein SCF082_LOCUS14367 [Durusdinium trenchii]|uniref:Uncharacterized protein n=1 Tax=Durusdinium trenchii TaxID=1381693 RepID=A0ABP0JX77_9DINO
MAASRKMAELAEATAKATESSYRMAEFGCTGAEMVGATVGSPVMVGPAVQELQSTVERLEQQVQDLSKRQAMMERELAVSRESHQIAQDNTQELI